MQRLALVKIYQLLEVNGGGIFNEKQEISRTVAIMFETRSVKGG